MKTSLLCFATSFVCLAALPGCDRPSEPATAAPEKQIAAPVATPVAPAAAPAPKEPAASPGAPAVPEDVKAPPAAAKKTASGLAYRVLQKGTGKRHPAATNEVKVHYSGWTTEGKMFDSSVARGEPISFPLNGVIKGWTEGVQLMVEGEKTRFWIPSGLAYGDNPGGGRPGGMLVFDIELITIQ
jgi:FKBP-type peptidyl-prolyl cis-trans isomerase